MADIDIIILKTGVIKVNDVPKYKVRASSFNFGFKYELWKIEGITKDLNMAYGKLLFKESIDNYGFHTLEEIKEWIKTKESV